MNAPNNVYQAVIAIWATLIIGAINTLIEQKLGIIDHKELAIYLFVYGLLSIFPYKISNRSNASRYAYTIITVISYFLMIGNEEKYITKNETILSILMLPIDIFIFYKLFTKEANNWFSRA